MTAPLTRSLSTPAAARGPCRLLSVLLRLLTLVVGCAPAAPAQPPPPAPTLPEDIRKLLDAPVWYLNYSVTMRLERSVSGGRELRERFTSGRMMLGVRSSGPSLSAAANPSLMAITQPGQIDALVANYANWLHGPPPEDESLPPEQQRTPEQQDAYFARVRQENVMAFHRHRYDSTASSSVGGTDRTSASGSGTVIHAHEPALEFDAVNRRFRLMFAVLDFVDSASTMYSFVGTIETGIGTIHYVRQEIKTGILTGDDGITSIEPAAGLFEGPLPATFGSIRHVSTHRVTMRGGGRGTLGIQFILSPFPPAEVELIIEPPAKYVQWQPLGDKDEKTAGDGIPIKVVLQKRGGGAPQFKPLKFTYLLWKTSREKGVCLNWPPNPDPALPFDLQFEQDENPNLLVVGDDRQVAVNSAPTENTDTVMVSSFDYGAHGEFAAVAELENGQVVQGVVKFTANQQELKLPFRPDGSLVASAFFDAHGLSGVTDDDDTERDPVGDGFTGDGLTLYEEYRGFMVGDDWTNADPKKKDLFVLNEMRGHHALGLGLLTFQSVTRLKVHHLLRDNQVKDVGLINFNRTSGPHIVDQSAIRIQRGGLYATGNRIAQAGDVGTPGTAKTVAMPPDLDDFLGASYMAATVAHELLHACNVYHHGENDELVWWSYSPATKTIYESAVAIDTVSGNMVSAGNTVPITVKREDGTVLTGQQFFPAGVFGRPVQLGRPHGLHSGHDQCMMRYDIAEAYRSQRDPSVRFFSGRESAGLSLCSSPAGTGVNDPGRTPESRYDAAATPQNGGPGILARRGDCLHQIRVNDLASEPKR